MQSKLNLISKTAKINIRHTNTLRLNAKAECKFLIYGKEIDIERKSGGSSADAASRINKASNAFAQLNPVWKSSNISRRTKIKIFNSNVKLS